MKFALTIGGLCLATLSAATAQGQPAANMSPSARPKVYALVAAIGDEFSIVSENMNVFSHIEHIHFSRRSRTAPDDLLNRLALESLDKAVARLEPDSKRIYLQFGMPRVDGIAASKREDAVLAIIQSQLRDIPERRQWDRILVATPAYRLFDHEGLAVSSGNMTRLQGFGVFTQPATGGESESFGGKPFRQHAISPDRKEVKSETFIAPFSYVEIWVLDARDLSVIDKQTRFDHQKLADPLSGSMDVNQSVPREFLARHVRGVIEGSIQEAVMQSKMNDRRGVVEVGPIAPVTAGGDKK